MAVPVRPSDRNLDPRETPHAHDVPPPPPTKQIGSPASSEESTLLDKNGGGSLNQPFIASYDGGAAAAATAAGAGGPGAAASEQPAVTALPALPRTAEELAAARMAQVEVPDAPREPLTGKALLIRSLIGVVLYLGVGVLVYTTMAGMDLVDALYFCVGGYFFFEYLCVFFLVANRRGAWCRESKGETKTKRAVCTRMRMRVYAYHE